MGWEDVGKQKVKLFDKERKIEPVEEIEQEAPKEATLRQQALDPRQWRKNYGIFGNRKSKTDPRSRKE